MQRCVAAREPTAELSCCGTHTRDAIYVCPKASPSQALGSRPESMRDAAGDVARLAALCAASPLMRVIRVYWDEQHGAAEAAVGRRAVFGRASAARSNTQRCHGQRPRVMTLQLQEPPGIRNVRQASAAAVQARGLARAQNTCLFLLACAVCRGAGRVAGGGTAAQARD
eukprot:294194-Chlamydomonas_euryale.AAC.1